MAPFEHEIDQLVADVAAGRLTIEKEPQIRAPILPDWLGLEP